MIPTVIGLNMLRLWDGRGTLEPGIAPLTAALSDGTAAPVVHAAVPFADAPEAHRILAARERRQGRAGAVSRARPARMARPSGQSSDMGDSLSRGQGEAAGQ
jgi:hypothetical protein